MEPDNLRLGCFSASQGKSESVTVPPDGLLLKPLTAETRGGVPCMALVGCQGKNIHSSASPLYLRSQPQPGGDEEKDPSKYN